MKVYRWFASRRLEKLFHLPLSRAGFLKLLAAVSGLFLFARRSGALALGSLGKTLDPRPARAAKTDCQLAAAKGENPDRLTRRAVEALGGIARFVRPGDVVVVKPNIGWDRTPEQAANTNPEVVAALVSLCREAGAKAVKVFDNPCNDARRTYANSGIQEAVRKAGGQIYYVSDWNFLTARFPCGSLMDGWPLYRDAVACDCFINVPVAKHHGLTRLTLSMKNLMGVCGGRRGSMHQEIDEKLVDVTAFIRPNLTVIDAYRILLRHGPTGGDVADVEPKHLVIASADPVLADAYAATLFGLEPESIGYIRLGAKRGLGSLDLKTADIQTFRV